MKRDPAVEVGGIGFAGARKLRRSNKRREFGRCGRWRARPSLRESQLGALVELALSAMKRHSPAPALGH
jgi:hypothetical protein